MQSESAAQPIPGLGLYHGDCRENPDVAYVRQRTVHQLHLHVAATAYTTHSAFVHLLINTTVILPLGIQQLPWEVNSEFSR